MRIVMHKAQKGKLYLHDWLFLPVIWFIPRLIRPNHITIFRFILVPFMAISLLAGEIGIGVTLFIIGGVSDIIDGTLARVRNQVTEWGTFFDPVADKILVGAAAVIVLIQHAHPIITWTLIILELMIVAGGIIRKRMDHVKPANWWGKIKMILEVVGISAIMISLMTVGGIWLVFGQIVLIVAILFAFLSLVTYSL